MPLRKNPRVLAWFWRKNKDLKDATVMSLFSHTPVSVELVSDRYETRIGLSEGVTSNDIRKITPLALDLQNRLDEWQGKKYTYFAEMLLSFHEQGMSYAEIANGFNRTLVEFLLLTVEWVKQRNAIQDVAERDRFVQRAFDKQGSPPNVLIKATQFLQSMRYSEQDANEIIREGLDNLIAGEAAFAPGYPVSREKVISALKYWRSHMKR